VVVCSPSWRASPFGRSSSAAATRTPNQLPRNNNPASTKINLNDAAAPEVAEKPAEVKKDKPVEVAKNREAQRRSSEVRQCSGKSAERDFAVSRRASEESAVFIFVGGGRVAVGSLSRAS